MLNKVWWIFITLINDLSNTLSFVCLGESNFGFDRHPESDERGVIPFAGLETAESWRREKIASLKEDKLARSILAETLGAAKEHTDALILDGPTSEERPQSVEVNNNIIVYNYC